MAIRFFSCGSAAAAMLSISLAAAGDISAVVPDAAAQQDEALAMTQMAARYEHAEGVDRDFQLAANLYCRAARVGRADAQYQLGWMYANGRGVPRDDDVAAALFRLAAAQGHEQSKRILYYVRPRTAANLPACLSVVEWTPRLKLSNELAAAIGIGEAAKPHDASTASAVPYSAMQATR